MRVVADTPCDIERSLTRSARHSPIGEGPARPKVEAVIDWPATSFGAFAKHLAWTKMKVE
jgi:hypothetical protein